MGDLENWDLNADFGGGASGRRKFGGKLATEGFSDGSQFRGRQDEMGSGARLFLGESQACATAWSYSQG